MNSFKTVKGIAEEVTVVQRSKFICTVKGVESEEDAKAFIAEIRKKHSLATHNCYAYIADEKGLIQKFSDDGEPQGTAGMPILNVLKSQSLYKTAAVVTRYFGGIKLGAGGLTRAYGNAVKQALLNAEIKDMFKACFICVNASYTAYKKISQNIDAFAKTVSVEYGEGVTASFAVKEEDKDRLLNFIKETAFDVEITEKGGGFFPF